MLTDGLANREDILREFLEEFKMAIIRKEAEQPPNYIEEFFNDTMQDIVSVLKESMMSKKANRIKV
jgi:hypothetical protein